MARKGNTYDIWLSGDNTVNIYMVCLWLLYISLPLTVIYIYIYTKFDLNGNSSFEVICRTRYREGWTEGQMDKAATICFHLRGAYK